MFLGNKKRNFYDIEILILILILISNFATAQQNNNLPIAIDNWILVNPAFIPMDLDENDYNIQHGLVHQQQFTGFKDAPKTEHIFGNYIMPNFNTTTGFLISNDQTGRLSNLKITGHFAYKIGWGTSRKKQSLNIGIRAGLQILQHNLSNLRLNDEEDLLLSLENQRKITPTATFGLQYLYKNKFYVGVVLPELLPNQLKFNNYNYRYSKQIYANIGANFVTGYNKDSYFQPSVWIRYLPNASLNFDALIQYNIQEKFYIGIGGNNQKSMNLQLGFIFSEFNNNFVTDGKLKIGVAYRTPTATNVAGLGNGFEVQVNYLMGR